VSEALQHVLTQHATVYAWASGIPQPRALGGRAPVYVAALAGTGAAVAVRHSWHGGLFAPLTGDRFHTPTRAPRELSNALRLSRLDIPTTEILGYALYPAGLALRRVDVASRFIPDAVDLGEVLTDPVAGRTRHEALLGVGDLLVRLAHSGVVHPDLNVKNILLVGCAGASPNALIIDVDVVRFASALSPGRVMRANLRRLVRSIKKRRAVFGSVMSDAALAAFERHCHDALGEATR